MPRLSAHELSTEREVLTVRPNGTRVEYRIKGVRNLVLRVAPTGTKHWAYRYLSPCTAKWRRVSLGSYPTIDLTGAKAQAIAILAAVNSGKDPLVELPSSDMTFGELVRDYLDEHKRRFAPAWTKEVERLLLKDVLPFIKELQAEAVTKAHVVRVVERVAGRRAFETADHVLGLVRAVYNWAAGTGRLDHDPTRGLKKRNVGRPRDRVLTDFEIRTVWCALESLPVGDKTISLGIRDALKLQLLLGTRIGEAIGAVKREVDLQARVWTIPGNRTKSRREHKLPLSPMAVQILEQAMERSPSSMWLFPSPFDGKPMRPKSASRALLRLRTRLGVEDIGTHDLRRTMSTRLGDLGVADDVIERVLNHAPPTTSRKHYNHARKLAEMRKALETWAVELESIIESPEAVPAMMATPVMEAAE